MIFLNIPRETSVLKFAHTKIIFRYVETKDIKNNSCQPASVNFDFPHCSRRKITILKIVTLLACSYRVVCPHMILCDTSHNEVLSVQTILQSVLKYPNLNLYKH